MSGSLKSVALGAVSVVGVLAVVGFGVESSVSMPDYAVVMADDEAREIYAPQCIPMWERQSQRYGRLRRTTSGDALRLHYKLNRDCTELGYFHPDGYRLTPLLLSKVGVLPPKKQWWDMPYRTEEGTVYPPETRARVG